MSSVRVKGKYKVHGVHRANGDLGNDCPTRFYETYEEARKVAENQATNKTNMASGNSFVIYRAIEVVSVRLPPIVIEEVL